MNHDYVFVTHWRVAARPTEVVAVLSDVDELPRWWPAVYLAVRRRPVRDGADLVAVHTVEMHTKGWLPYTLRWTSTVDGAITEEGFALTAAGDLEGAGRWTFTADGPETVITYDWRITATKPLLRRLGWLLRPVFAANHRWAMARGEESLRLELRRRRAVDAPARALVPEPPVATFSRWRSGGRAVGRTRPRTPR